MTEIIDIQRQLEHHWIDQWFEAMRRRKRRRLKLCFIAICCRYQVVQGGDYDKER